MGAGIILYTGMSVPIVSLNLNVFFFLKYVFFQIYLLLESFFCHGFANTVQSGAYPEVRHNLESSMGTPLLSFARYEICLQFLLVASDVSSKLFSFVNTQNFQI